MAVTLETLDLKPEELELARQQVRLLAYRMWEEAGCPANSDARFWEDAERDWIGHQYVPDRLDLTVKHSVSNGAV